MYISYVIIIIIIYVYYIFAVTIGVYQDWKMASKKLGF